MQGERQANTLRKRRERERDESTSRRTRATKTEEAEKQMKRERERERERENVDGKKRRLVKLRAAYTLCCQSLPDTLYSVGDIATPFAP